MKILFTIGSLTSGGAERVLVTLANFWASKGWDITLLIVSSHDNFYKVDDTVKLISLDKKFAHKKSSVSNTIKGIRETIKEVKPDIIISFITIMNILTLIANIGLKIPIIISERNYFDQLKKIHWQLLRTLFYRRADGMVVLSEYDYNKYTYVKSKRIIFNPLNKKNMLDVKFKDKDKLIIAVGDLIDQKGFDMLIESLSTIDLKEWKVMIVGEGKDREMLNSLIKEHHLEDKISLIGRKSNIFDYYKKASIFVLSSRYEGFPNVLAEAMSHGCACVAFDCKTGPSDMIENHKNGLLVEANNSFELGKKINFIMRDKELREKFFKESLNIKVKLDIDVISEKWENYISTFIQK